jgi:hypothetical protein
MIDYSGDDLKKLGSAWIDKIKQAEKREKDWMKDAEDAECAYLAGQTDSITANVPEWNILHSNVETIVPAIYNSTPNPDIRPRHTTSGEDPMAKVIKDVADLYERGISMQIDDNRLDAEMEALAQDVFVAGRGILRMRFDADVEDIIEEYMDETGQIIEVPTGEQRVVNEQVIYENVAWRDYREGPAKKWRDVPWVAFRHFISEAELERIRDEDMWDAQRDKNEKAEDQEKDVDVWEIWCRESGKVYFITEEKMMVLKVEDDPLGLPDFFPCAEPVQPITATGKRIPVCPYKIYKTQAEELNRISKRIMGILAGLKVRGGVATAAEAISHIAQAGDNELIPISDVDGLIASGGIDGAVLWWPIDKAIVVLKELYVAREQIKNSIYEITGISDIIRGHGKASETATAQQIKTEWGSLRIKKMQRLIERQVRDAFVITAEIMSRHFSPEGLFKAAGMPPDPQLMQFVQGGLDHYRIDVESDSTVRADTSQKREEMARFLEGTGQFFSVMAPIVAQAPQGAGILAQLYGAFTAQFNLGKTAEDAIAELVELAKKMAQEPPNNPQKQAMEMEMQAKQGEMQLRQVEMQTEAQVKAAEMQLKREEIAFKREELAFKRMELEVERAQVAIQATQPVEAPQVVNVG